jgi:phosphonate transport system ATP-binding protein
MAQAETVMNTALRISGMSKRFGDVEALCGVSLAVEPGEFVAVLGPSGSGKSTLFRCVTRLTEPDAGEIWIAAKALHGLSGAKLAAARRDIGVVFQQFNLIRRRSALENVLAGRLGTVPLWRIATKMFQRDDIELAAESLNSVGLADQMHQRADTLSGGQQQRVAIARALAQKSRILLADEPVASLDPESAQSILELMHGLAKSNGLAVLCTLHQPHLAERFADRVIRMRNGRLIETT